MSRIHNHPLTPVALAIWLLLLWSLADVAMGRRAIPSIACNPRLPATCEAP